MAKKKRLEKPKREFTKRQLSQWERQKKRQRLIFTTLLFVIVAVILTVGVGWYVSQYRPMSKVVLKVGDKELNMGYFVNMLEYYGAGSPASADNVVKNIEQNEAIIGEAGALGITVTNAKVDEQLKKSNPPTSTAFRDPVRVQLVLEKLRDDYFDKQVPETAEQRHVLAMLLESESQTNDVKQRIEKGESFNDLAQKLSLDEYTKTQKGDLDWRPRDVINLLLGNQFLEEQAFTARKGELTGPLYDETVSKSLGYWLVRVLERKADTKEAHVQGILLEDEGKAKEVKAKLDAGGNFADLAKEYSQYGGNKDNSGDFGMVSPGMFGADVDTFIFNSDIELRTVSQPIRDETFETKGGYWLIKVDDIQNRDVDGENRDILTAMLLRDWIDGLKDNPKYNVENFLTDAEKSWAIQQASKALKQQRVQR